MFRRILVPTDFSFAADAAWRFAVDLAVIHDADLVLLHVAMPLASTASEPVKRDHQRSIAAAERRVSERTSTAMARGLLVKGLVAPGERAEVIAAMAEDESVDLIVIGGHPQPGATDILVGSVAERVVRVARCPVLVVKPELRQAA